MPINPFYYTYIVVLCGSIVISCLLFMRVWWLRTTPGAYGLILALAAGIEWLLAYIFEIVRMDLGEKIFWAKAQYFGISSLALGILVFTIHYVGRSNWLTRPRLIAAAIPSIVGMILAFTNESHHLIWSKISFTNGDPFGPLDLTHGTIFYFVVAYQYILLLVTALLFVQVSVRGQSLYRIQARIMLAGMLLPWAANFLYVTGYDPFPTLDLTPIALTFTNLALSIGFLRYRFMDLQPVAHGSVFNAMKDGVVVLDYKERIADINPVGSFIFQNTGNLLGYEIGSLLPKWNEWHQNNPVGEIHQEFSVQLAGEELFFNLRTTSLFDDRGQRNGRVLLMSDITQQKRAAEQLAEVSRMKSQLLASFGHDLRSPLGAIIGYAEMLKDGSFGEMSNDQVKASSEILDSANQLLSFINNLVGQAQIETGKIVLREFPFDIDEVIGPLLPTLNFHAHKKGLLLKQIIDSNLPHKILGDQFWVRQIVLNLVHNAVKFTDKGHVQVRFYKHDELNWAIEVSDTGVGIPMEAQKRVFEAFEKVDHVETTTKQIGFGLGLSIVARLTSIMNGKILLKSEEGRGATFTLILPLKIPVDQKPSVMA